MTKKETAELMAILQINYPDSFQDDAVLRAKVNLWAEMFKDDAYPAVAAAIKAHIVTDTNRFMPPIGVIKAKIQEIMQPDIPSEMEAWALVRQAIRGASMEPWSRMLRSDGTAGKTSAEQNFEALPPIAQKVVAAPSQLAEWEKLNDNEVNTVIQSNFMRSYRARVQDAKAIAALPEELRKIRGVNVEALNEHYTGNETCSV